MNPLHLLDQAEALLRPPEHGPPRQADKRRAISAAYYALFHAVLRAMADEFVGVNARGTPRYELVYRSVSHARLATVCRDVVKPNPSAALASLWPSGGFSEGVRAASVILLELMPARHEADYSAAFRVNSASARRRITQARIAVAHIAAADREAMQMFLTLLLCSPRT